MIGYNKWCHPYKIHLSAVICITILLLLPLSAEGSSEVDRIVLGPHFEVFHDSSNEVTIEDLIDGTYDQYFIPSTQKYAFFGIPLIRSGFDCHLMN